MSIDACVEMVRSGDPDRFMSVMASPPDVRARLFVLYAFNLEIARAPWVTKEEMIAEMRLQWWADAIDEIYQGKLARHHEVVEQLALVIHNHDLPRDLFDGIIAARRFDIYAEPHQNRADLDMYIRATSGNLMRLAGLSLGAEEPTLDIIRTFSYGVGVGNLFRALPALYANKKDPIPVNGSLDRNAIAEGQAPENLRHIIFEIAEDAAADLQAARAQRHLVPKHTRAAFLPGWQAMVPVWIAYKTPELILSKPLETSEFQKKSSLMWAALSGRW